MELNASNVTREELAARLKTLQEKWNHLEDEHGVTKQALGDEERKFREKEVECAALKQTVDTMKGKLQGYEDACIDLTRQLGDMTQQYNCKFW